MAAFVESGLELERNKTLAEREKNNIQTDIGQGEAGVWYCERRRREVTKYLWQLETGGSVCLCVCVCVQ